jgi:hypothetical protein
MLSAFEQNKGTHDAKDKDPLELIPLWGNAATSSQEA